MSTQSQTPRRRAITRPSFGNVNTVSTPNLAASYSISTNNSLRSQQVARKASLSALTQGSLATISDASEGYGLSTVQDEVSFQRMARRTSGGGGDEDIEVGDLVDVPGHMYGTVKFVGNVDGKRGTFAGVELAEEFAGRGKNNGDVDG
jgi:hypothetical protein